MSTVRLAEESPPLYIRISLKGFQVLVNKRSNVKHCSLPLKAFLTFLKDTRVPWHILFHSWPFQRGLTCFVFPFSFLYLLHDRSLSVDLRLVTFTLATFLWKQFTVASFCIIQHVCRKTNHDVGKHEDRQEGQRQQRVGLDGVKLRIRILQFADLKCPIFK